MTSAGRILGVATPSRRSETYVAGSDHDAEHEPDVGARRRLQHVGSARLQQVHTRLVQQYADRKQTTSASETGTSSVVHHDRERR